MVKDGEWEAFRDQAVLSALPPLTAVIWDQTLPLCGSQMPHLPAGRSDTCHGGKSTSQSFGETQKDTRWTSALNLQRYVNKAGGATCLGFGLSSLSGHFNPAAAEYGLSWWLRR